LVEVQFTRTLDRRVLDHVRDAVSSVEVGDVLGVVFPRGEGVERLRLE
jgi:hypothetical protein